jgi:hypothetical protein
MKPGWYEHDLRKLPVREIYRLAHPLLFPLVLVMVKLSRAGGRNFYWLPHVTSDARCGPEDVPAALRERLEPLAAIAAGHGFTLLSWSNHRARVHTEYQYQVAGLDLFDGIDTVLRAVAVVGNRLTGANVLIDRLTISALSFQGPAGPVFHTTNDEHHSRILPRLRNQTVRTTDPAVLLRAHRARPRGDCRITREDLAATIDAFEGEQWEQQIARGQFRHVCDTREELAALIGEHPDLGPAPDPARDANPYATPKAPVASPGLIPVGDDPRRRIQVRADRHPDLAEWALVDGVLTLSGKGSGRRLGQGEAVMKDADAFSRLVDLTPRWGGVSFRVLRSRRVFAIPMDFVRLMLADFDVERLITRGLRKRFRYAFLHPLGSMVLFGALATLIADRHGSLIGDDAFTWLVAAFAAVLGLHALINLGAWIRPDLRWYRIHYTTYLAYAGVLALFMLRLHSGFLLMQTVFLVLEYLVGLAYWRMFTRLRVEDADRRRPGLTAPAPPPAP